MVVYEDEFVVKAFMEYERATGFGLVLTWPAIKSDGKTMLRLRKRRLAVEKERHNRRKGRSHSDSGSMRYNLRGRRN